MPIYPPGMAGAYISSELQYGNYWVLYILWFVTLIVEVVLVYGIIIAKKNRKETWSLWKYVIQIAICTMFITWALISLANSTF